MISYTALIAAFTSVTTVVILYLNFLFQRTKELREEAGIMIQIKSSVLQTEKQVEEIKATNLRVEQKVDKLSEEVSDLKERIAKVEEHSKSAHKRIDHMGAL